MSAPSLAGANHAQPKDLLRQFLKRVQVLQKMCFHLLKSLPGDSDFSPESLGARSGPLAFRHSGFGATQVRTQNCMNLCEVGLVIVNWVFLGKRPGRESALLPI